MGQIISKGTTYAGGDTVTHLNLNSLVDNASFVSGPGNTTDDTTIEVHSNGYLKLKDTLQTKINNIPDDVAQAVVYKTTDSTPIYCISQLSQNQYNAITPDPNTLYVIT